MLRFPCRSLAVLFSLTSLASLTSLTGLAACTIQSRSHAPAGPAPSYAPGTRGNSVQMITDARCSRIDECGQMPSDHTAETCSNEALAKYCSGADCNGASPMSSDALNQCASSIQSQDCASTQRNEMPAGCEH